MSQPEFSLPTPGKEHELLAPFEGKFKATVKMWMGPGDPMVSTGTMENSFHLNGLYLHQDYSGQNFAGKGYWGYNQTSKCFEGFWIDVASTTMQMESGQVDEAGKVWTMHSEVTNPMTGEPMQKRSVITLVDDDHNKIEMFYKVGDQEMKNMEIEYERI